MFGFFESQEKKMRANASNWLEVSDRVWNYRRDRLSEAEGSELRRRTEQLKALLREKADAARLKIGIESLEEVLARTGGSVYPKSALVENVEFFLVAAIVILGIRTYFVQPFKIPTNSMWPTYWGMKADNFAPGSEAPGLAARALRFLALGAQRKTMVAPRTGEVTVPFFVTTRGDLYGVAYTKRPGRSWLIFPATEREYTFYVDGVATSVRVPDDFMDMDDVVLDTFFPDHAHTGNPRDDRGYTFLKQINQQLEAKRVEETMVQRDPAKNQAERTLLVPIGRTVKAGEPIVRFDVLTGDQLFVDRVSYNFVRPSVGQGFVFRTDHIPEIESLYGDQYFIKRLIGVPGDKIEIREPAILRNGAPISGSSTFALNANRVAPYRGYQAPDHRDYRFSQLFPGDVVTVPPAGYLALGDNSYDSFDGRYWGFVPERDVIGRPLFIYYPFTRRWGTAR